MCVLKMLYVLFLMKLRKLALYNNNESHNVYLTFALAMHGNKVIILN